MCNLGLWYTLEFFVPLEGFEFFTHLETSLLPLLLMFVCFIYVDVTITDTGLHILTDASHLWPLSSEGSLACHTYWNTGHPSIMVISDNPFPSVWQWSGHYLFNDLGMSQLGFEHPTFRLRGEISYSLRHRRGHMSAVLFFHVIIHMLKTQQFLNSMV